MVTVTGYMRKLFLTVSACLYAALMAAQTDIKVEAPNVVAADEQFNITFIIEGEDNPTDFQWASGEDFQVRRLQKDECLETYDMEFGGRNRRYYKITEKGRKQLMLYCQEWKSYSGKITKLFEEVM